MANIEIDEQKIYELLQGDRGVSVLLEPTREPDHTSRDNRAFEG
ncbi:hypothetical protein GGP81_002928 [Salinibacter ruber]|jgi:hypothetical protein|nr:hypothetical protein [Salinibacter ruber]MCS3701884.1 hypothetical protein [Salinibacter ruber]MCS3755034.1 hypothetical protein [Salinibacter ruber]MCS3956387.1 hypothetical protein [Salinibacter ruber]MCS4034562.1 hypothetical protein [Salinibacter ruber]